MRDALPTATAPTALALQAPVLQILPASLPLSPAERDQALNDADQLALRDYDRRERATVGAA